MKKSIVLASMLATAAAFAVTGCNHSGSTDTSSTVATTAAAPATTTAPATSATTPATTAPATSGTTNTNS